MSKHRPKRDVAPAAGVPAPVLGWRCVHGHIVAEVTRVPGVDMWAVCAYSGAKRADGERQYSFLADAHAAADTLAALRFGHRCDSSCGRWAVIG